jgi:endonuclease III
MFRRLGMGPVESGDYDTWQKWILGELPFDERDEWAVFRAEIVLHCKYLCTKNRPKCGECLLRERCPGARMFDGRARFG